MIFCKITIYINKFIDIICQDRKIDISRIEMLSVTFYLIFIENFQLFLPFHAGKHATMQKIIAKLKKSE